MESYSIANALTNRYGIETLNSVMLGLPGDTYETMEKTIDYIRRLREVQQATFSIAIPYPGSEMYEMAVNGEYGLVLETEDFSQYQRYNSAVMSVNGISPEALLQLQKKAWMKVYCVPWRILPIIRRFGIRSLLVPFIQGIAAFFKKRNGISSD